MSARWRRSRKRSQWFEKALKKAKKQNASPTFKNLELKRKPFAYKYRVPRALGGRKCREPEPLIDILENDKEIMVVAEFAGYTMENIRINVKNQRLTLSAETSDRKYYKSLNLPNRVIPNTIRTNHKNGVLEIRLKKSVEEKPIGKLAG
ncbi:MAG: Hsp20/alpha crystallin family protein [Candidatus Bathyarchaeota archaeon]|nr:Hsp20/alpha crystallin family protein [Candidatus Bathyarchaeota archaeon]